jgi:16S rRNA G1207 methylase RsmC
MRNSLMKTKKLNQILRSSLADEKSQVWILLQLSPKSDLKQWLEEAIPNVTIQLLDLNALMSGKPTTDVVDTPRSDGACIPENSDQQDVVVIDASTAPSHDDLMQAIETAFWLLRQDGRCYLFTHTHKGAESHRKMLTACFANAEVVGRGGGGVRLLRARRNSEKPNQNRLVTSYGYTTTFDHQEFTFVTRPGLFSRDRLDWGTRALIECVHLLDEQEVLDLGCGYGPIGVILAKLNPTCRFLLVDIDPVAVAYARTNISKNRVTDCADALVSDGFEALEGRTFDRIVSHIPLHVPNQALLQLFADCARALRPNGQFIGVALSSYHVENKLERVFSRLSILRRTDLKDYPDGYTVYDAHN